MSISAVSVRFDEDTMWVSLSDGRVIGAPLAWFPRLMGADAEALAEVEVSAFGLHWAALDEDVSVVGLLEGKAGVEAA
ncbi:DUF2442 domain-containing protein [Jannaschia sp. CCS1]|uniref:DUF2442 domain-containing protein n=1 Tax=Jannaschia sp. (strain CCS1) TaxID=290400 RepID=UPI000053DC5C|nr:DUF2442 domain-containing protein [Jannaschia sp. CCS1]ABD56350.1 hypothetical protein Jann_3433 [Jannaschia sp. CCS1]